MPTFDNITVNHPTNHLEVVGVETVANAKCTHGERKNKFLGIKSFKHLKPVSSNSFLFQSTLREGEREREQIENEK